MPLEQLGEEVRRHGPVVVTGVRGSGKSALCADLAADPGADTFAALLLDPIGSESEVLVRILEAFGVVSAHWFSDGRPVPGMPELVEVLDRFLAGLPAIKASAVLIVDEAQNVPTSALVQIGRLARLEANGLALLQVVLVGTPELTGVLKAPELALLNERVATTWELEPPTAEHSPAGPAWLARRVSPVAAVGTVLVASALAVGLTIVVFERLGF